MAVVRPVVPGGIAGLRREGRRFGIAAAVVIAALAVVRCSDSTPPPPPPPPMPSGDCVLSFVIDGDSVRCADGREIRILSIDAPEMAQEPWGARAREELLRVAPVNTALGVEYDAVRVDTFDRDLAYLFLPGGEMLNEHMVASGYALAFIIPPNRRHEDRILAAEAAASAAGSGLWGEWGFTCRPADFRRERC
ncbi:thermonuclease family protein [Candidatus Palauibacter polyketidifaciens]|uniref:thermonuclease family protein n=1 Tax=Candidatus Palauibacter polyketidifaciens TaxID=3056740 RepID=UPI00239D7ACC|nr:thermonuclease family protein [Candidatus Palauibacter polyketidifaciens]MDE2720433.1 thermonuclease family protein [Candidatus Palauibacter polyketidifaciens]